MIAALVCWAALASLFAGAGAWTTFKLGTFVIELEDDIAECLEVVGNSKSRVQALAATEVMSDEPVVRQAVDELSASWNALEQVSKKITEYSITGA